MNIGRLVTTTEQKWENLYALHSAVAGIATLECADACVGAKWHDPARQRGHVRSQVHVQQYLHGEVTDNCNQINGIPCYVQAAAIPSTLADGRTLLRPSGGHTSQR